MPKELLKYKNTEWSIPIFINNIPIWGTINAILQQFKFEIPKINLSGNVYNLWSNHNKNIPYEKIPKNKLKNIIEYTKEINATPTFTFTSTQLTKEDLKDEYANFLLDIALENDARFIVYSDILRDYIKEKKSDACTVASVIKSNFRFQGPNKIEEPTVEKETNYYNKLLKEYDIVVVRPEYSITTLTEHPEYIDDISRIEVMINQPCIFNCPMPCIIKEKETDDDTVSNFKCIKEIIRNKDVIKQNVSHSNKDIVKLINNGVSKLAMHEFDYNKTPIDILHQIYNLMFNNNGKYYHVYNLIGVNSLEKEINYFKNFFDS